MYSNQSLERLVNTQGEPPNLNHIGTVPDANADLVPDTLNGADSLNNNPQSHAPSPAHEAPDALPTMASEKLTNVEDSSETEEIPIASLRCAREGKGKQKVIDVPSEDDDLEIIGVREPVTRKPNKIPVLPCIAWRTRLSRGKQERVSYSNYFQKLSDDSGDEPGDDKRDEDAVEDEEEGSTSSHEEFDKSESDGDVEFDDGLVIGDWQKRSRAFKRKIMKSDDERDGAGVSEPELDGFMHGTPAKKLKPDNLDEVHVIESDLEMDLDPDRGVLRSASSDSDWEDEIRYIPSSGVRGAGFGATSNGLRTYQSKSPGSKSFPRPYQQSVKMDRSGSRSRLFKRYKSRSITRGRGLRGQDLMRILVDKMCGENGSDNWPADPNQYRLKDMLPMVFCFAEELDEREKKKSEEDRELDELWADYEFALESENIGRYHNDEVQWFRNFFLIIFAFFIVLYMYLTTTCLKYL